MPLVLAGGALAIAAWLAWDRLKPNPLHTGAEPRAIMPRGELADFETATIRIFEENAPSVVHIVSRARSWSGVSEGEGTGFVWDARGYVVTNYHVVQAPESQVIVRLQGLEEYEGVVVGAEPTFDIAVVKLVNPPSGLRPIPLGSSKELAVGQSVFAIGNPFGLSHTLTTGVVSALDRVIQSVAGTPIQGVIQVDAAINPGNSGGPLLDSAGRLIGMNTALISPTKANVGIGFAVPVDAINRWAPRLIEGDKGTRPVLGIRLSGSYRLGARSLPMIGEVVPGTGAEDAGLKGQTRSSYGDIIVAIDGVELNRLDDLFAILDQKAVGDVVRLKILRGAAPGRSAQAVEIDVTLKTASQRR